MSGRADSAASGGGSQVSAPLTERGARTREKVLVAAREVFEERGFLDTRVAHIAHRAQVAYGSFYTYFPSKEAVFLEVADRLFAEMTDRGGVPTSGASPAVRIRRSNRSYYEGYLRNAKMMAIVEQVATFNEEFQELRRKHRATSITRTTRAIRRWQCDGLVPDDLDAEMTARALAAMIDHSLYLWIVQGDDAPDAERLLETLDSLTHRALGLPDS